MKISTPVITLLSGTTLGAAVLVASIVQTPSGAEPVNYAATSPTSAGTTSTNGTTVTTTPLSAAAAARRTPPRRCCRPGR
jgi:hypothetical protein